MKLTKLSLLLLFIVIICAMSIRSIQDLGRASAAASSIKKSPIVDTFVVSGRPTETNSQDRFLRVGYDEDGGRQEERILLKFDLPLAEIPVGSTINAATLSLYLKGVTRNDEPMNVTVSQIPNNWSQDINWNQHIELFINPETSATSTIDLSPDLHVWNITDLVRKWSTDANRSQNLSLILVSNKTSGQHERAFWANDCKDNEKNNCNGKLPKLEIFFEAPTPVPPTPIPTPTPGVIISLSQSSSDHIGKDQELVYTIAYQNNGIAPLSDVLISNKIPDGIENPYTDNNDIGRVIGDVFVWNIGVLTSSQSGQITYTVTGMTNSENFIIQNEGAIVVWSYAGYIYGQRSNAVFNPSKDVYIPIIIQ